MKYVFKSHRLIVAIVMLLLLTIGLGLLTVPVEKFLDSETKFEFWEDGVWWAFTTVTGVGYGDYYPITTPGRIIGIILETIGVTAFGLTIAFITISLLRKEQQFYWGRETERFDRIEEKLDQLEKGQAYSIKENGKL